MAPVGGQRSAFEDGAAGPDQAGDRRDALSQGGRAVRPPRKRRGAPPPGGPSRRSPRLYHDRAFGVRDDRPGLDSCLRALRKGDVLVVWKLDRLGRNLAHLVNTVQDLSARGVGLRVLAGDGAQIDTTTAAGRLVFGPKRRRRASW